MTSGQSTQEQPDGRDAQGKVREKEHGTSMPSPGTQFSPHLHVFTNLEVPVSLFFKDPIKLEDKTNFWKPH